MGSRGYEHGSAVLGTLFTVSVFGPMAILAALWAFAVGQGQAGDLRDLAGELMIWVLLVSGLIVTVGECGLILATIFQREKIDWPMPALAVGPDASGTSADASSIVQPAEQDPSTPASPQSATASATAGIQAEGAPRASSQIPGR